MDPKYSVIKGEHCTYFMFLALLSPWFPEEKASEVECKHSCLGICTEEWFTEVFIFE